MEENKTDQHQSAEWMMDNIKQTVSPYNCASVWFFGQESVVIKGRAAVIHVDPFYSDYVEHLHQLKRSYSSLLRPADITVADLCLITHEHEDHLDPWTLKVIASQCPNVTFIAPLSCRAILETACGIASHRIMDALTGSWLELEGAGGEKVKIKPVPAAHETLETQGNDSAHRFVGYLIELNGVMIYHAGDTVVYPGLPEMLAKEHIELGLLPINGRDYFRNKRGIVGNMNYREAAELAWITHMDTVIPLHYDIFAGNSEKPGTFVQELYERFPRQKCHVMARGERFVYVSPKAFNL